MDLNTEMYPIDFSEDELEVLKGTSVPYKTIHKKLTSTKKHKDGFYYIKFTIKEIRELNEYLAAILNRDTANESILSEVIDRLHATLKNTAGYPIID